MSLAIIKISRGFQAATAAVETSDSFAASMHWATYRASELHCEALDAVLTTRSSPSTSRVLETRPQRRAKQPIHAPDRQHMVEGLRSGSLRGI